MNILLLLISLIFWWIFYIFYLLSNWDFSFNSGLYLESLSWNLIIESVSFILIWVFLFFWFSNFSLEKKEKNTKKSINFNFSYFLELLQIFVKKYLYYIGLILAYSSFYFILKYFWYNNFSYFIITLNIIVLFLFILKHKFLLFRDFIKINTILFSIYYIIFFILSFYDSGLNLGRIDIINTILIFIFFLLTFFNDNSILKSKKSDLALVTNFFVYTFLFLSYYLSDYLTNIGLSIFLSSTFLFSFIYFFITKIEFFKNNIKFLKIISILISYVALFSSFYLLNKQSYSFFAILNIIYISVFNFYIHYKYQNYISFFMSFLGFLFIIFYFYFKTLFFADSWFIFLGLGFSLATEIIIYSYFYNFKYKIDYYFTHIISYLITIFVIVYYFYAFSFDLLTLGIILLLTSMIALWSYFRLKQIDLKQ